MSERLEQKQNGGSEKGSKEKNNEERNEMRHRKRAYYWATRAPTHFCTGMVFWREYGG